jgi:dephospho-CoA kinase
MENHNIHASETAWVGTRFDAVIDNNGTMDQLFQQITDLLRDLRAAKASPLS